MSTKRKQGQLMMLEIAASAGQGDAARVPGLLAPLREQAASVAFF